MLGGYIEASFGKEADWRANCAGIAADCDSWFLIKVDSVCAVLIAKVAVVVERSAVEGKRDISAHVICERVIVIDKAKGISEGRDKRRRPRCIITRGTCATFEWVVQTFVG